MKPIRLESIDPEKNRARFYVLYVTKTLWNTWALLRRWGRIGQEARGEMRHAGADGIPLRRAEATPFVPEMGRVSFGDAVQRLVGRRA